MPVVACPSCKTPLNVPAGSIGSLACPKCQAPVRASVLPPNLPVSTPASLFTFGGLARAVVWSIACLVALGFLISMEIGSGGDAETMRFVKSGPTCARIILVVLVALAFDRVTRDLFRDPPE